MLSSSRMLMSVARRSRVVQRRNFGGSAAPAEYTGAEAKIRAVLPKDEDVRFHIYQHSLKRKQKLIYTHTDCSRMDRYDGWNLCC
jgi:hypothetical protein